SIDGKESRHILAADSGAVYASGHLLWAQNGSLVAQPFDPVRGALSGEPIPLSSGTLVSSSTWRGNFDASDNGVLVYHEGSGEQSIQLQIRDRTGKVTEIVQDTNKVYDVRFSPDGHKLAFLLGIGSVANAWLYDLDSKMKTRLTFQRTGDGPAWSPDGK